MPFSLRTQCWYLEKQPFQQLLPSLLYTGDESQSHDIYMIGTSRSMSNRYVDSMYRPWASAGIVFSSPPWTTLFPALVYLSRCPFR